MPADRIPAADSTADLDIIPGTAIMVAVKDAEDPTAVHEEILMETRVEVHLHGLDPER